MPSPFPGMDPYLESPLHWGGVHALMNGAITSHLNGNLPAGFVARLDQYVWLTADTPGDKRAVLGRPDVFVAPRVVGTTPIPAEGVAVAAELTVATSPTVRTRVRSPKVVRRTYVKITTLDRTEVLTVIELLSPSNKVTGSDRTAYSAKRNEHLAVGVNLVEIDLLRAGDRMPVGRPRPPATDYYVVVWPAAVRGSAEVWAFGVRDALPTVTVPVKPGVGPVTLDLRACLDRTYDDGRFQDIVRYDQPADPPLRRDDAEWAAECTTTHA